MKSASERVCVTGGSGFIANHVVKRLLDHPAKFTVVATVRNKKRVSDTVLEEWQRDYGDRLVIEEADLLKAGSFDKAFSGCSYVVHVASPIVQATKDPINDLVKPAVEGTQNVLNSCEKSGTVRRVVVTSSVGAVTDGTASSHLKVFDEKDFNTGNKLEDSAYSYSKTQAELKAWDFFKTPRNFDMICICPGFVVGPIFRKNQMAEGSGSVVHSFCTNQFFGILDFGFSYVHVEDVADAHIWAMQAKNAKGRYILANNKPTSMADAVKALKRQYPHLGLPSFSIPNWVLYLALPFDERLNVNTIQNFAYRPIFNNSKYLQDSGATLKSPEQALIDAAESLRPYGVLEPPSKTPKIVLLLLVAGLSLYWWFR